LVIVTPSVVRRLRPAPPGFKARDVIDAVSILDRCLLVLRVLNGKIAKFAAWQLLSPEN